MTADEFRSTLDRLGLTQAGAAELLDRGIRTIEGYAAGRPIPLVVELALCELQRRLQGKKKPRRREGDGFKGTGT
jgi:hypothetical protein